MLQSRRQWDRQPDLEDQIDERIHQQRDQNDQQLVLHTENQHGDQKKQKDADHRTQRSKKKQRCQRQAEKCQQLFGKVEFRLILR